MIDALSEILKQQWLTDLIVRFDTIQIWAEIFHYIGLTLLIGTVGLLDLRMIGLGKGVPFEGIHRLVPWGIAGFALCLVTGMVFISGDPFREPSWYLRNIAFQAKMACVILAGLNVIAFYALGLGKRVNALGPNDTAPRAAQVIAWTSLGLWIAVMYFGRMLPWQDALYLALEDPWLVLKP